jgi:CTP-dependent riboflavin kinase
MPNKDVLKGTVVSGARKAAFFTQLDWVNAQCEEKLGFRPFPGTLNIELLPESLAGFASFQKKPGRELTSPDPAFCSARVIPVLIENIPAAVILPDEQVRIHGHNIIEAVAPVSLRRTLNINDGDIVCLRRGTGGEVRD